MVIRDYDDMRKVVIIGSNFFLNKYNLDGVAAFSAIETLR